MTNIDLNKKAYSTWGYKDYQLWLLILFIALPSVAFAYAGLSYYGGTEWCIYPYRYDWMPITNIIIITIITIVLFTTMVYYIKLLNKLKKLKKPQADYISISAIDESKQAIERWRYRSGYKTTINRQSSPLPTTAVTSP
nr:140_t:CDS:2 [Entrophospora candida]